MKVKNHSLNDYEYRIYHQSLLWGNDSTRALEDALKARRERAERRANQYANPAAYIAAEMAR